MKVDIAVKAIIYNKRLNKILLLQRCPKMIIEDFEKNGIFELYVS